MQATLLTLILVAAAPQPAGSAMEPAVTAADDCGCAVGEVYVCDADCGSCGAGRSWTSCWFGAMSQTCYAPRFGCYPGNNRHMYRYPAFHGYYYRQAYNYRQAFDYPWHIAPHEPQGYYSYGVQPQTEEMLEAAPSGQSDIPSESMQPVPAPPLAPAVGY